MAGGGGTARTLLSLSSTSSSFFCRSLFSSSSSRFRPSPRIRVYLGFNQTLSFSSSSSSSSAATTTTTASDPAASRHAILLERLRLRHLKDAAKLAPAKTPLRAPSEASEKEKAMEDKRNANASSFEELGLEKEVMGALEEMKISVPTEIQCIGVPAVLEGKSVVLGSHTGSGKTLAYLLPLVQLMRRDEVLSGMIMRPRRPRAVVLCPTRELCEQVFRVSKSISHHARFRSTMISGGGRLRPQEDSLNGSIDMVVGTPGRILQHIEEGNMVYGDIKYLVLDEADTMFDRGFGPDIRKFLGPLKNRAAKPDDPGFQTVLVTATMTKAVQSLVDEEFQGIIHLRTSTLHRRVASARHDFIKLSGSENKLEALLQVLEPSLTKGNRVMVFCNTLNSSRAVDHFLSENQILTVNYHGEVPAEERVENLKKFKSEDGDCPTLVCTDLAARGLDLDVDHVIMFDFPSNSIDYLHRTGRTARMGAKGKVTSLVAKKDVLLATRIEEAIKKNESLEALNVNNVRKESASPRQNVQKGDKSRIIKVSNQKSRTSVTLAKKSPKVGRKATWSQKTSAKAGKSPGIPVATYSKAKKSFASGLKKATLPQKTSAKAGKNPGIPVATYSKVKKSFASGLKAPKGNKRSESRNADGPKKNKLSVVGFRGRSSSGRSLRPT